MKMKIFKFKFIKLLEIRKNKDLKTNSEEKTEEDYVSKRVGSFGIYQMIVCTIASLSRFIAIWNLLSFIFIAPKTDFICEEFKDNMTVEVKNSTCYSDCLKYKYHQEVLQNTLISKFELICEKTWLVNFNQIVLLLGVLVGSTLFGWISDRKGRRVSIRLATFFAVIFMLIATFSISYWMFVIVRFIVGITSGGILVISAVYIIEVVGASYKESAVSWFLVTDAIAELVMIIFAYFSSTWDIFLMEYFGASLLIFGLVLSLPDSLRWYIARGREDRAIEVASKAARWNNQDVNSIENSINIIIDRINDTSETSRIDYMDLFNQKDKFKNTICIIIIFSQVGIGFHGINQYINFLAAGVYSSVILHGLIQVPASLLSIVLNKLLKRRTLLIIVFFVNGVSILIFTVLSKGHWIAILVGVINLSSIIIAYSTIFIFVAELYPTQLRSTALGVGMSGSTVGVILTSFVITLKPLWIPSLILAFLSFLVAGLCVLLPETKSLNLQDR